MGSRMEREEARIGSAPKDHFNVQSANGSKVDPSSSIFAILRHANSSDDSVSVIGTGFYIGHHGLFVSARHVLEECLDERHQPTIALTIVHRNPKEQKVTFRPVVRCFLHNGADIGVGMGAPMRHDDTGEDLWANSLVLSSRPAVVGDKIATYAYPNATTNRLPDYTQRHATSDKIGLKPYTGSCICHSTREGSGSSP